MDEKFIPSKAFNDAIAALIAADTAWLASASPITVRLTTNEFTPSDTNLYADMAFAEFTGSAAKTITTGAQVVVRNEETGGLGIQLKEPAGGLNFVCTAAPGSPVTITGAAIILNGTTLIAAGRLASNKVIQFVGDYVTLSAIFGFLPSEPFDADSVSDE